MNAINIPKLSFRHKVDDVAQDDLVEMNFLMNRSYRLRQHFRDVQRTEYFRSHYRYVHGAQMMELSLHHHINLRRQHSPLPKATIYRSI